AQLARPQARRPFGGPGVGQSGLGGDAIVVGAAQVRPIGVGGENQQYAKAEGQQEGSARCTISRQRGGRRISAHDLYSSGCTIASARQRSRRAWSVTT